MYQMNNLRGCDHDESIVENLAREIDAALIRLGETSPRDSGESLTILNYCVEQLDNSLEDASLARTYVNVMRYQLQYLEGLSLPRQV